MKNPGSSTARAMARRRAAFALAASLSIAAAALAQAPDPTTLPDKFVSDLNAIDLRYMERQRQLATELTLRHYGGLCCRNDRELDYLQRLLDDGHVRREDAEALQAMGVVLGDLLAAELDLEWVVYEDAKGRSRALRLDATDNYLFPVTMISRRREAGDLTPVAEIYAGALAAMDAARPPRPFEEPRS